MFFSGGRISAKQKLIIAPLFLIFLFSLLIVVMVAIFNFRFGELEGKSMEPTIPEHSLIAIRPVPENIKIGQIVLFNYESYSKKASGLTLHRVVEIENENRIVTKGDNNEDFDMLYLRKKDIKGVYAFHIPLLGYIFEAYIWIPLVTIIALILSAIAINERRRSGGNPNNTAMS